MLCAHDVQGKTISCRITTAVELPMQDTLLRACLSSQGSVSLAITIPKL